MRLAALAGLAAAAGLHLSGCAWLNRKLMYVPSRQLAADPSRLGLSFESVAARAPDGPLIHGWWVPLSSSAPVVLLCHGNGGNISHRLEKLRLLREAGASVLLFDYRGYGQSTGTPSERGTYADAETMYRWLVETEKIPPSRIVFHGESLGCGVAIELAVRHEPAGLIVESGFTSTLAMARLMFPHLPVKWLVRYRYDNLSKIGKVAAPVLVMHSPQDEIVPFEMGRQLYAAARRPKTFVELRGSHNEGFLESGPVYVDALRAFFAEVERRGDSRLEGQARPPAAGTR